MLIFTVRPIVTCRIIVFYRAAVLETALCSDRKTYTLLPSVAAPTNDP